MLRLGDRSDGGGSSPRGASLSTAHQRLLSSGDFHDNRQLPLRPDADGIVERLNGAGLDLDLEKHLLAVLLTCRLPRLSDILAKRGHKTRVHLCITRVCMLLFRWTARTRASDSWPTQEAVGATLSASRRRRNLVGRSPPRGCRTKPSGASASVSPATSS